VAPLRESTLPIGTSYVNLANQVGSVPFFGNASVGTSVPFM
jgi:hypothetical protein